MRGNTVSGPRLKKRVPVRVVTVGAMLMVVVAALSFGGHALTARATSHHRSSAVHSVTVFATGLNNPRGLTFGPDGNLYVAEGGLGGFTSRISRISPAGVRTTVVDGLPSSQTSALSGGLTSGVAAVQFIGNTLYGIEAGAGCSHGLLGTDNTLFQVNANGTTTTIADLSVFQKTHPVANPEPDDFEPDGTWFSMVAVRGKLYAVEPNHGELDQINLDGTVRRVVDISASQGHIVPTSLAYHGTFYVGNLNTFPITPGSSKVLHITPNGQITTRASGLTTALGLAFDADGNLYALETDTVAGFPGPDAAGSGKVVRVNDDGSLTTIADGLTFPTGITFGPDGALYVSNNGFDIPVPGVGQIVRITL